ncbi:hypothetical protein [Nocardioides lianchengensis]|uniref:Uncharacterized protein n=1 Tax=Nocardioides lianchengensis TaxID=1045774 RepID=A0A1G6NSH0_9ACTN|nr:hypothetical protein [Nocardioides lianchengensis]NYG10876.1 hypothetical protein [Nocardioides lianchengensis]SDC70872.1 hypothetical protein SAMN05421872_103361 [Nocardioides lianchengensis]
MTSRPFRRLVVAALVVAATSLGVVATAPQASASTCSDADGVSVIVDFKQLGGGVQGTCVDGAGQKASALFPAAGFGLEYVQSEPGFVCRVALKPDNQACADTPPNDAFWGLWWTDGRSGTWSFSNYGVGSLKVPAGGSVAFAWKQGSASATPPGVRAPVPPTAAPTPTSSPSAKPTKKPSSKPSSKPARPASSAATPSPSAVPSSAPSSAATDTPSTSVEPSPSGSLSASTTAAGSPSGVPSSGVSAPPPSADVVDPVAPASSDTTTDEGVPTWLVLTLLVAIGGGTAGAVVLRRRSARSSGP